MTATLDQDTPLLSVAPGFAPSCVKVLVVVEGMNDMEFLRRISRILHADQPSVADLGQMERDGTLLFLPVGGSDHRIWSDRLAPLRLPEFHLYDRDVEPRTTEHRAAVDAVNRRQGCIAALTTFRHVENYIHPQAIAEGRGVELEYSGEDDVAELLARKCYHQLGGKHPWKDIPQRRRRQMKHRAKRWLNTMAVDRMTSDRLDDRDPVGDVRSWLEAIQWLAAQSW